MKVIITKISDGSVWAKSVNPLGEELYIPAQADMEYDEYMKEWQQAESERLELQIGNHFYKEGYFYHTKNGEKLLLSLGDTIEVTLEGDKFKIL